MTKIKICGITNLDDALKATEFGADALGFIFAKSQRQITPLEVKKIVINLPPFIVKVGVFVNYPLEEVKKIEQECKLDILQFHGDESPDYCNNFEMVIKTFQIKDANSVKKLTKYKVCAYLLDTYLPYKRGGTGKTFNWQIAKLAKKYGRIILSGGLKLENILEALKQVKPYAIDVSSGIEKLPGKKDWFKMKEFIKKVREFDVTQ